MRRVAVKIDNLNLIEKAMSRHVTKLDNLYSNSELMHQQRQMKKDKALFKENEDKPNRAGEVQEVDSMAEPICEG